MIQLDRLRGDAQRKTARSNDLFHPATWFLNEPLSNSPPLTIAHDYLANALRLSSELVAEPCDTAIPATNCE